MGKPLHFESVCKDLDIKRPRVLQELHPQLEVKVRQVVSMLGGRVTPYCGYRGPHDQAIALERGTSEAKFGDSPHNYHPALACDLVLDPRRVDVAPVASDPTYPNLWDAESPAAVATWADLEAAAEQVGLERVNISSGRDKPHVQLHGWRPLARLSTSPT